MHHHRELLAPGLVGHAEGGDLVDLGAFEDRALDLGGIDVLAAADHQVLGTVRQEQVAVVVEVADVTAVEPAVAEFGLVGFGAVPVAADQRGCPDPQPSRYALWQFVALFVADAEIHRRMQEAGRAGLLAERTAGAGAAVGVGLGQPPARARVGIGNLVHEQARGARRRGRAAAADAAQARGVEALEVAATPSVPSACRRGAQRRDALALDQFQRLAHVPLVHHHHAPRRREARTGTPRGSRSRGTAARRAAAWAGSPSSSSPRWPRD
jgi:hypothetical protein